MTIKTYPIPFADEFNKSIRKPIDKEKAADTIRFTFFGIFVISLFTLAIAGAYHLLDNDNIKVIVGLMIFSLIPLSLLKKEVEKNEQGKN